MLFKHFSKKAAPKTVFTLLALGLFAVTCLCAILPVASMLLRRGSAGQTQSATMQKVDLAEAYPFAAPEQASPVASSSVTARLSSAVTTAEDLLQTYAGDRNLLSPFYYGVYGKTNRLLSRNIIENSEKNVFLSENGDLLFAERYQCDAQAMQSVAELYEWLDGRGTGFLYVLPASKSDDSIFSYPQGFSSGYAAASKEFLSFLSTHDIPVLSAKELLLAENPDFSDWFYRTDHHWNVQAGLFVADAIAARMEEFGFSADRSVFEADRYESLTYPGVMFGSIGQKVSLEYLKAEDLEVLYPRFETEFYLTIPSLGIERSGSFKDALIDLSAMEGSVYEGNAYLSFLHGNPPLIQITNRLCATGPRVLVLKDSKANIVNPYLACAVGQLDVIDPRGFRGSIRTYIEQTEPDLVIICASGPISGSNENWCLR